MLYVELSNFLINLILKIFLNKLMENDAYPLFDL